MKIIFDGRWIGRTGIGRYASELLRELQELDHDNQYLVLLLPEQYAAWHADNPNFTAVRTTHEVYTWQEQLLLPWQLWRLRAGLTHFTSFNAPMLYPGRFVVTVHDLTLVHFKNVRGGGAKAALYEVKYWAMRAILRTVVRRARQIVAPSRFGAEELTRRFRLPADRVTVTYEAATRAETAKAEAVKDLPEKFLLYVGNYYPYKNIGRLVEAFGGSEARKQGWRLVLAGPDSLFAQQVRKAAERLGVAADVVFTGRVSDGELATLYQRAGLYVFPSLYEGFGLPGLEAMAQGTPVLAARATCLPEVYGEAAAYFDPLDVADMTRQIDAVTGDQAQLEQLKRAGAARVKEFSWRRMAEQTLAVYQAASKR